ncbi:MAG: hypothetical protein ABSA93_19335 [Streptosporangiaceae bacterium]
MVNGCGGFLAPSKSTSLGDRVRHLEQSLAQSVSAEAAGIGRIERDLRDEAQPRMAVMGKGADGRRAAG